MKVASGKPHYPSVKLIGFIGYVFLLSCNLMTGCKSGPVKDSNEPGNHLQQKKLKGKVKTVTYYDFMANEYNGQVSRGRLDALEVEQYDRQGYMVAKVVYDNKHPKKIIDSFAYSNNGKGNPILTLRYNGDGSLYASYKYQYNQAGLLKHMVRFTAKNFKHTEEFYTYSLDRLIEYKKLVYDAYTHIPDESKERYKYNEAGQNVETISFNKLTGKYYTSHLFEYDRFGNKVKETGTWADGRQHKTIWEYDDEGREVAHISIDIDGEYRSESRYLEFDSEGNWQILLYNSGGKLSQDFERRFTYY